MAGGSAADAAADATPKPRKSRSKSQPPPGEPGESPANPAVVEGGASGKKRRKRSKQAEEQPGAASQPPQPDAADAGAAAQEVEERGQGLALEEAAAEAGRASSKKRRRRSGQAEPTGEEQPAAAAQAPQPDAGAAAAAAAAAPESEGRRQSEATTEAAVEGSNPSGKKRRRRSKQAAPADEAQPAAPAEEPEPDAAAAPAAAQEAEGRGQGDAQEGAAQPAASGQPVLPWMQLPVEVEGSGGTPLAEVRGLDSRLQAALLRGGFQELYPVQAATWALTAGGASEAHDLCVCVPTGSGKTLAYALPLLQGLTRRAEDALGALVVLPTRELAVQVWTVLGSLAPAVGLRAGLASARLPLAAEAAAFAQQPPNVLVATPGRLMAHLGAEEPAFTLASLRFLVVDETDRLLRQGYQQWLPHVVAATGRAAAAGGRRVAGSRVVKFVVSATLTQDPAKIARLQLHAPRYVALVASRRYKVPQQLREFRVACAAPDKPLVLIALLQHLAVRRAIVFTGSLVATRRLAVLLRCFPGWEGGAAEHSSRVAGRGGGSSESEGLAAFRRGEARVLVASDALTRGMDIPEVDVVVNYDPAAYPKTYVHRAGRTARAGRSGTVVSLLTPEQVRHFKALLRKVDNTYVRELPLPARLVRGLRPAFAEALAAAGAADAAEQ